MNKWSLLLFSVLGILLSSTSEPNIVDGRLGWCNRSSRPLSSDTGLLYKPDCTYHSFTQISHRSPPKRDIRYATKNVGLKRSSQTDVRGEHFEDRQSFSDDRLGSLRNVASAPKDSILSNVREKRALRETDNLERRMRRNLKSFKRENFEENHVDRSRSNNNDFLNNKMERNSRERGIDFEVELSGIRHNRFRDNYRPVSVNLKDHKEERFSKRIRTGVVPSARENIDERQRLVQKNKGMRDMERTNLDITARQRSFRDTRLSRYLSSDLERSNNKHERLDVRFSEQSPINENRQKKYVTMQLSSKILRNENIRDDRRLLNRYDTNELIYGKVAPTNIRQNTDEGDKTNLYRRNSDDDITKEVFVKNFIENVLAREQNQRFTRLDRDSSLPRAIQRESQGLEIQIGYNQRLINGYEERLIEKRNSVGRLPRLTFNINRLQEVRKARIQNDLNIEEVSSNVFIERTERASDHSRQRKIRDNNHEIRESDGYVRISSRNKNSFLQKREVSFNINNRRSEVFRRNIFNVFNRHEREDLTYRLDHRNENIFDQKRARQNRNSHFTDKLREARNTRRRLIRSNAMGRETNNIRRINIDDNVPRGLLERNDINTKLGTKLERERLTNERSSRIGITLRENQNRMNSEASNIQKNRNPEDRSINFQSRTKINVEKRQPRTYNKKSYGEVMRSSLVRETERAFDESRIRQLRDNRESRQNTKRINVRRVLTDIDRNRNNVVGNDFAGLITRSAVTVFKRREHYEVRRYSGRENERIFDQRRVKDVLEGFENDLNNERLSQRSFARKNSRKNAMLIQNRQCYNDENNSQVFRSESSSSVNKRSPYFTMVQRIHEHKMLISNLENKLRKDRSSTRRLAFDRQDSYIYIIVEDRRAEINYEKLDDRRAVRNILVLQPYGESGMRQLRESRNERHRDSRFTPILRTRGKDVSSLLRLNERDLEKSRNGIVKNGREITKMEDHSRNSIADIRDLRRINERSNTRHIRNRITGYVETAFDIHDSDETHQELGSERVVRNTVKHETSGTRRMRDGPRTSVSSNDQENSDYVRKSDRNNNRGRIAQDTARDIRDIKNSRLTKTRKTNVQERETKRGIRPTISVKRYLKIEQETQSDLFGVKTQYIFYLLQGLYILGLFAKFTKESNKIQKRTRFSNWFLLFSTIKEH